MEDSGYLTDKRWMTRNFDGAANGYDEVAVLQKTVAGRLADKLEYVRVDPVTILDLGSGTGAGTRLLRARYRRARIVQMDIATGMLQLARSGGRRLFSRDSFVCGDAESLPFRDDSFDLVYSSLMLQWCIHPDRVFVRTEQALKTGGLFMFSTLGPDTLKELRQSWAEVDDRVHVNAFIDMHDLGDALVRAGFESPVMETEYFTLRYRDLRTIMRELKQLGAQNVNLGRRKTLTGRDRMRRLTDAYERFRVDERLPTTWEIVYGHAWCRGSSPERKTPPGGVVAVPVSSIRRAGKRL